VKQPGALALKKNEWRLLQLLIEHQCAVVEILDLISHKVSALSCKQMLQISQISLSPAPLQSRLQPLTPTAHLAVVTYQIRKPSAVWHGRTILGMLQAPVFTKKELVSLEPKDRCPVHTIGESVVQSDRRLMPEACRAIGQLERHVE